MEYKKRKDKVLELVHSAKGPILHYGRVYHQAEDTKCEDGIVKIDIGTERAYVEGDEHGEPHLGSESLLTIPDVFFTESFLRQYSSPKYYPHSTGYFKNIVEDMSKEHKIKLKELLKEEEK